MIKIVCIEDDVFLLDLMKTMLAGEGVQVQGARSAQAGLARVREFQPDLVTLDESLPDRPGAEVLRALRADPQAQEMGVVIVSGWAEDQVRSELDGQGIAGVVRKPFTWQALRLALSQALESHGIALVWPDDRLAFSTVLRPVFAFDVKPLWGDVSVGRAALVGRVCAGPLAGWPVYRLVQVEGQRRLCPLDESLYALVDERVLRRVESHQVVTSK